MKSKLKATLLTAVILPCAASFGAIETWVWTGTLNLVSSPFQSQFAVGDTFTVRMDIDTSATPLWGERSNFRTSVAHYYNIVGNSSVTVNDYTANFQSSARSSNISYSITNGMETADSQYYDQLQATFYDNWNDSINAPAIQNGADTYTVNSIELNLHGGVGMIVGSGAAFPTVDVPMLQPGVNFFPEQSTNGPYHFIIRFKEGDTIGSNMIRGTFTNFTVVPEPSHGAIAFGVAAASLMAFRRLRRKAA